jgi:hypothetical protein
MPAPSRRDADTATELRAFAASVIFESSVHAICSSSFLSWKRRRAEEREIVMALFNFAFVKKTLTLEAYIEMEAAVFPVPVMENGRAIGWVRAVLLQSTVVGKRATGPRSRAQTVIQREKTDSGQKCRKRTIIRTTSLDIDPKQNKD